MATINARICVLAGLSALSVQITGENRNLMRWPSAGLWGHYCSVTTDKEIPQTHHAEPSGVDRETETLRFLCFIQTCAGEAPHLKHLHTLFLFLSLASPNSGHDSKSHANSESSEVYPRALATCDLQLLGLHSLPPEPCVHLQVPRWWDPRSTMLTLLGISSYTKGHLGDSLTLLFLPRPHLSSPCTYTHILQPSLGSQMQPRKPSKTML